MSEQTISIIGCGWLGLPVAQSLLKKSYQVNGSTTRPEKLSQLKEEGIKPFLVDLRKRADRDTTLSLQACLEATILLINIPPGRRNPHVLEVFPAQMKYLIQQILLSPIQKVLFISSTSVYQPQNKVITEDDATQPIRASGQALLQVEQLFQQQSQFQTSILRMSGLYGGTRHPGRFLAGKQNLANGEAPVNLVHLDDCIGVIEQVIEQEKWGELYNVCSDEHPTRREMYTSAARKLGLTPPHFAENATLTFNIISNQKVKQDLAYSFRYPNPMEG